jgi:hypothetical protein
LPQIWFSSTRRSWKCTFTPICKLTKLDSLATETGRRPGELVEDVVAGYFDELMQTRDTLNSRYTT